MTATPQTTPYDCRDDLSIVRVDHDDPRDAADVRGLLAEYLAAIKEPTPAETRHQWLYLDNPHGRASTFLARDRDSGRAVALTSLFPRAVLVCGQRLTGSIGGDGYVTPAFRRRGIATSLHRAALLSMSGGPVEFMFGPPEPNNLKALVKAGAIPTGHVQRFIRPMSLRGLGDRLGTRLPPFAARLADPLLGRVRSRLRVDPLQEGKDERVDAVWRYAVPRLDASVVPVRDAEYYEWRFGRAPNGLQRGVVVLDGARPIGAAALERRDSRAAIVDLFCAPRDRRRVLGALLAQCRGVDAVRTLVHVPSPLTRALTASGFAPRERVVYQVTAPPACPHRATLLDDGAWYYTDGDVDIDHVLPA